MALTDWKQIRNQPIKIPVKAVTTVALPANTYANGTAGAGATLTANANGALPAIDGVALVVGDRALIKDEATQANNGIYQVTQLGDAGNPYILTRTDDCNTNARIFPAISVESTNNGTANGGKLWVLTTIVSPVVVGVTALTWDTTTGVMTIADKELTPLATSGNGASTGLTITYTPANNSYVIVMVNGTQQVLGNGVLTKDCYFSSDGGVTAKSIGNIQAGDALYWNGNISLFSLSVTDRIDFDYEA